MYDERPDPGGAGAVFARGVLWLGATERVGVSDRNVVSGHAERVSGAPLLGNAHGPRLLELLDAACGRGVFAIASCFSTLNTQTCPDFSAPKETT